MKLQTPVTGWLYAWLDNRNLSFNLCALVLYVQRIYSTLLLDSQNNQYLNFPFKIFYSNSRASIVSESIQICWTFNLILVRTRPANPQNASSRIRIPTERSLFFRGFSTIINCNSMKLPLLPKFQCEIEIYWYLQIDVDYESIRMSAANRSSKLRILVRTNEFDNLMHTDRMHKSILFSSSKRYKITR